MLRVHLLMYGGGLVHT